MKKRSLLILVTLVVSLALLVAGCGKKSASPTSGGKDTASADNFPTKPIQIIVPVPAGGPSDTTARAMEKVAQKYLGQPLVVINTPGGAGTIGFNQAVESKPDGYTLALGAANMILQPLYGGTKHNYPEEMEPIAQAVSVPIVLAVPADAPWNNLKDFVEYAKKNPGQIKYAYTNVGSLPHVVSAQFVQETGIKIDPVPFQGGSDALTALLGGHVKALFTQLSDVRNYVKEGKLKLLGISTEQRLPDYNNVPTYKEQGFNITAMAWFGVAGPKGLPDNVRAKLAEGFKNIVNDDSFKQAVSSIGFYADYLGPEEFGAKWKSQTETFSKVIKESGLADQIAKQNK